MLKLILLTAMVGGCANTQIKETKNGSISPAELKRGCNVRVKPDVKSKRFEFVTEGESVPVVNISEESKKMGFTEEWFKVLIDYSTDHKDTGYMHKTCFKKKQG